MPNLPMTIALRSITCLEETDEVGADEPYVLVTIADLGALMPTLDVVLYGPWTDVDKGESRTTLPMVPPLATMPDDVLALIGVPRRPFWGMDRRTPLPITNPDRLAILVSLVENDDNDVTATRTLVMGAAVAALTASTNLGRADRVARLREAINGAINVPGGAPNFDDLVGTRELRLTAADVDFPGPGVRRSRSLEFRGDGGHYRVRFDLVSA